MNTPPDRRCAPWPASLVAAAAVAVIVMCTVGVAAVMGWLPTPSANTNPNALSAESAALAGPEGGNLAPAPQIPAQPLAPAPGQQPAARQPAAPRPQAPRGAASPRRAGRLPKLRRGRERAPGPGAGARQ